jgi:hypothetical protein
MIPIVSILAVLFMFLVPFGSASAYTGGLLNGKIMNVGANYGNTTGTTPQVTDNDLTSNYLLNQGGGSDTLWYEFSSPVTIDSYQLKSSYNSYITIYAIFPDDTTQAIDLAANMSETKIPLTTPVENVKGVYIVNTNTDATVSVSEFDVFGTGAADTLPPANVTNLMFEDPENDGTGTLSYYPVNDTDFSHYNVYKNGVIDKEAITYTTFSTSYIEGDVFKVTSVDTSGNESTGSTVTAFASGPVVDETPPAEITNLVTDVTQTDVNFTFDLPLDEDFDKVNVYKDGVLHGSTTTGTYSITGLTEATAYSFKLTTVDALGNESAGTIKSITTLDNVDTTAPMVVDGLTVTESNAALIASWDRSLDSDVQGYNVYVDGVKHNSTPVTSTSYIIQGLENDISYEVYVTAVDTSLNESAVSLSVYGTPSSMAVPLIELGYDLGDVAEGTSSWFSSLWLIIAFASAIPLAFYVGNRLKLLFVS